jgi:hypothetical protein
MVRHLANVLVVHRNHNYFVAVNNLADVDLLLIIIVINAINKSGLFIIKVFDAQAFK